MKLVKQSAELVTQQPGVEGLFRHIEYAGRTAYKSIDKMTEDSAQKFVDMLIEHKHLSVLEHGIVYLHRKFMDKTKGEAWAQCYYDSPYSHVRSFIDNEDNLTRDYFITTNYRVITEHNREKDLEYMCERTPNHVAYYTVKVTTDIGVSRELNRHEICVA